MPPVTYCHEKTYNCIILTLNAYTRSVYAIIRFLWSTVDLYNYKGVYGDNPAHVVLLLFTYLPYACIFNAFTRIMIFWFQCLNSMGAAAKEKQKRVRLSGNTMSFLLFLACLLASFLKGFASSLGLSAKGRELGATIFNGFFGLVMLFLDCIHHCWKFVGQVGLGRESSRQSKI